MNEPKIVAMYRVKNEERWIRQSLKSAAEICSEIVILDDGSTDNTLSICKGFKKVVNIYHQPDLPLDEVRDKNKLLEMVLSRNADYLLALDGDEMILPNTRKILLEEVMILYPDIDVFEFQVLYIWDKPNQYRYDGSYSNAWHKRLIKMRNQPRDLHFDNTEHPGNLHCGSLPSNAMGLNKSVRSRIKILHYGNYDEKLRQDKYRFYTNLDPNNVIFDGYKHIVSGEGKLSGPNGIEFRVIPEGLYIADIQ